ncbi:hypothetical protein P170DRAFT_182674 [Aspergillus steynii IBT 23096]|uniref:Rhodopsin domain-containing protein n=1 Tax=Aspergillus steynii IBT 23096 TaxID=1392250 RepID=A0A2I2G8Z7_9EURO|nr:uncharacterized protein P170DRAFT_182674 [Aspergillus steynii IBT 23096]PLB49360.1 hypothetical protein P170DRAFT_182674 [Aspergillus steynii IBT 23096]
MAWVHNLHAVDPDSRIDRDVAICLVFSVLAFAAVGLRFWIRLQTKRCAWADDFAALSSAVLGAAYTGIAVGQTRWGLGTSAAYFPIENAVPFGKIQYAGGPVYTLALLGFKVSLLSSYLRIGGFIQAYKVTIIVVIVAVVCNQLIFTFLLLFACRPIAKQWDMTIPGKCINTVASYYALAGTSLGFDLLIIALPLPVLWGLRLRLRQRIALLVIYAVGFFITVIQIIRIFTIKALQTYTDSEPIVVWSSVEISLGVIVSCVPTYGTYFHTFATNVNAYWRRHSSTFTWRSDRSNSNSHGDSSRNSKRNSNGSQGTTTTTATTTTIGSGSRKEREGMVPEMGTSRFDEFSEFV